MFGYVKPFVPDLKVRQNELYKAVYCGLCKRQKKLTGFFSAFSLSYDFVFLALVRSVVTGESFSLTDGRCAYNPIKKKKVIDACCSIDYTACVASVLTYYKLLDDFHDSRGLGKARSMLLLPFFSAARKKALAHNVPDGEIRVLLDRLSEAEKENLKSPDVPAEIFGEILSVIAVFGIDDDLQKYVLAEIFKSIGKWIYIVDAVDDLCHDIKKGNYNPFKEENEIDFSIIKNTLQMTLTPADACINKIRFSDEDISQIIKNIVLLGTFDVEEKVIAKAKTELNKMKGIKQ